MQRANLNAEDPVLVATHAPHVKRDCDFDQPSPRVIIWARHLV